MLRNICAIVALSVCVRAGAPMNAQAQSLPYFAFLPVVMKPCPVHSFIQDGGMEAGVPNPHWFVSSSQFSDVLEDSPDPAAHTGTWKAWMGGDNSVTEVISQTFAIPAGVTQFTLRYWVWIDTHRPVLL